MSAELRRFGRFLVVGLLNTGVGYALYALFLLVTPMGPQAALALSFALGVAWNYLTTARLVFGTRGFARMPAYVIAYLAVYALNAQALHMATLAGWNPLLAQALLVPFAAVLTYVAVSFALTYRRAQR